MKKTLFITIIAAIAVCSCAREEIPSSEKEGLTLTFSLPDFNRTKAGADGVTNLNENLINSCYYFLFKEGDTTGDPAVKGFAAGLSAQGSYEETLPVSTNTVNNVLFKDSRSCHAFVVVNPTSKLEAYLKEPHSLQELRAATVASVLDGKQKNFVMVHDGKVNVTSRADETALSAELELTRLACKFTFHVKVAAMVKDGTDIWNPVTDAAGLNVTVSNLLGKSTLSGFNASKVSDADYFETSPVAFTYEKDVEEQVFNSDGTPLLDDSDQPVYKTFKKFNSSADSPVYSYPMKWDFADKREPYLMFEQAWQKNGSSTYEPRYYKLILGQKSITSNDWYDITVKIDVLGSFNRKDPTVLFSHMDYLVKGWNDAFSSADEPNTPANIKDVHYLMTYANEYLMDNVNTLTIPFASSHKCIAEVVSAKYDDFSDEEFVRSGNTLNASEYTVCVNATNDGIVLTHNLVNEVTDYNLTNDLFDYCQYTFSIKLYQEGKESSTESEYCKFFTVKQNPALVVNAVRNDKDGIDDNGKSRYDWGPPYSSSTGQYTRERMYTVFVNGNQKYYEWNDSKINYMQVYGKISYEGEPTSISPNLYSVTVSVSDDYIIGDPRRTTPWSAAELTFSSPETAVDKNPVSAPHFDGQTGGNRTLQYYYPTCEDADHENMIAPKFLIVSGNSYCYYYYLNKQRARQRCATYQEYGYPAGRWRIPTLAETQYLATLMAYDKIPTCFQNGETYWTASGPYTFSTSSKSFSPNPSASTAFLRCVYDEWYWENSEYSTLSHDTSVTPNYTQFVWGDMSRENFK